MRLGAVQGLGLLLELHVTSGRVREGLDVALDVAVLQKRSVHFLIG